MRPQLTLKISLICLINVEKKFILKLDNYIQKGNCMSGFITNGGAGTILGPVGDKIKDAILSVVMTFLGPILWGLCDIFFLLLDLFELIFKKLAGIDTIGINGETVEGDIVLYLIRSDVVQNIFFSVLMLSLCLLIIFTVVAIVKNQYMDKPKPVMNIINSSFKGLLMYLLVPIATVVCLMVGSVVLQAIDGATRAETSGSASDMLFITAAYNANKLRSGDFEDNKDEFIDLYEGGELNPIKIKLRTLGIKGVEDIEALDEDRGGADVIESVATLIDEEFTNGSLGGIADKWGYYSITTFYKSWNISILTVWVGGAFLIWAVGKMSWGVASRLYKMTIAYAISPALMAMYPLDDGKALGGWKGDMVKNGTMAYCAVGVLNILYSILPLFLNLSLFDGNLAGKLYGNIVRLFLVIIAYSGASKLIEQVSGWFNTGNALVEGVAQSKAAKDAYKGAVSKVGNVRKKAFGAFRGFQGGVSRAKDLAKAKGQTGFKAGASAFLGGLQGAYKGSGLSDAVGVDTAAIGKEWNEAYKTGSSYYQDLKTNTFNKDTNKANKALFEQVDELDKLKKRAKSIGYDDKTNDGSPEANVRLEQAAALNSIAETVYQKDAQGLKRSEENLKSLKDFSALVDNLSSLDQEKTALENQLKFTTDPSKRAELDAKKTMIERKLKTAQKAFEAQYAQDKEIRRLADKNKLFQTGAKAGTMWDMSHLKKHGFKELSDQLIGDMANEETAVESEAKELKRKKASFNTRLAIYGAVLDPAGIHGLTADELARYTKAKETQPSD